MKADLHIHTTASDGCWTPERLLAEIKKKGIGLFSVTDHDSVDNVSIVSKLAVREGVLFLPGVEISSTYEGHVYHILGYGINPQNKGLSALLKHNTQLMNKKDDDSIELLVRAGYKINFEEYLAYQNVPARGGWKALNYLIDCGLCTGASDFFKVFFPRDWMQPFPVFPVPGEVIATIEQAGGIAVLAHPGSGFNRELILRDTLDKFLRLGIRGIECYHPEHDREKTELCLKWCRTNNLHITGGSDCHGGFIPERNLGIPEISVRDLRLGCLLLSPKKKHQQEPRIRNTK